MEPIIDYIAFLAEKNQVINQGDYIQDNLLHCGVCGRKKQMVLPNGMIVRCNCECAENEYQRKRAIQREQEAEDRRARLRSIGINSYELRKATFDKDDHTNPASELLKKYADSWNPIAQKNSGLLLYGGVGAGKSWAAACVANALIEQNIQVMMTNSPRVLNALSASSDRNAVIDDLVQYPLLILDDFGVERSTEYVIEQVFNVIDGRDRTGLPLIITTNLSLEEFHNTNDVAKQRIYSRIINMCSIPIDFGTRDRRKEIAKQTFLQTAPMLKGEKG